MTKLDIQKRSLLARYLWPLRGRVSALLVLLLCSIALQALAPQLMRRFLDQARAGVVVSVLMTTAVLFFIVTLSQKIVYLISVYLSEDIGWGATNQLRLDLTDHVLRLDMGFHKLKPAGELIERIDGDISNLAEYFSQLVVSVFANLLLTLIILLLLFRENWRVGLIAVAYAGAMLLVLRLIQNRVVRYWHAVRDAFTALFGFVEERLGGLEDIRANGGSADVLYRLALLSRKTFRARVLAETVSQVSFSAGYMLYALALAGVVWVGVTLFRQGETTIGGIVLLISYIGMLEKPINAMRREAETLQRALASIGRVQALFAIEQEVVERQTAVLPQASPQIRFDRVGFAYKDRLSNSHAEVDPPVGDRPAPVLTNITFTLNPGRVLGVLGRTGSGKTTLTRLLFRLYDVDEGSILFDGIDIRTVGLADLRQRVGLVTQDVQLFEATIRDNLTLFRNHDPGKRPISDDEILAALTALGLRPWLVGLENGLDTRLQSGGRGLSAGEAQLVALTRVFLRDPSLLILDEASSRLDPESERLLERALDTLLQNRTGIIIAHRLETVHRADDILILEHGRIVEHGERLSLLNNPHSRFAQLLRMGSVDRVMV